MKLNIGNQVINLFWIEHLDPYSLVQVGFDEQDIMMFQALLGGQTLLFNEGVSYKHVCEYVETTGGTMTLTNPTEITDQDN